LESPRLAPSELPLAFSALRAYNSKARCFAAFPRLAPSELPLAFSLRGAGKTNAACGVACFSFAPLTLYRKVHGYASADYREFSAFPLSQSPNDTKRARSHEESRRFGFHSSMQVQSA
ncbi:MAG: hypothetical protein J5898_00035, partial [Lachnospiraceae bacterium]|nr:hypothetical protein [Lachnospiraceae bacterium]